MSDSILYLAIVAIWAIFLVPAWIRRPNASRGAPESDLSESELSESELSGYGDGDGGGYGEAEVAPAAAYETDAEDGAAARPAARSHVEVGSRDQEYGDDVREYDVTGPRPGATSDTRSGARRGDGPPVAGPLPDGPSQSREQMMHARRRMLTILTTLTLITGAFTLVGLVQWWICVPPAGMLAFYVLLLREIAMADAELVRKRRAWEARAALRAREARQQAWAEDAAAPTAKIIDISSRVGDQLYDQYADAAVRAVGD
ncbi:MAG TPA: hypothetical protein VNF47_06725 [Streptosporangiaceae bacterium]|nr:hypothetical protein [Streptosporangiaceae bacterium]